MDKRFIALGRSRTSGHANSCKGISVGIRGCVAVRERFQKFNDLVLLGIRQAQFSDRHVKIIRYLGHRPAGYFFNRSRFAVP